MFMETGFLVNGGHDGYNNVESVISDGATSNRAQIQGPFDAVNNPRGWVAGAAVMEWCGWVDVPTSAASTLWVFSTSTSAALPHPDRPVNSLGANIFTNTLSITQRGPTQDTDTRQVAWVAFRSTYSGQRIWLSVVFTQGTATNPVIKVNGTDISASFSLTTGGTPPAWLDAAMVPTYHLTGYNWPAGRASLGQWILGSLTAAESIAWMITGQPPAWVAAGGSAANIAAGSFVIGRQYLITAVGTTSFTSIGASANTVGVQFTATGVGSGTGTAQQAGALSIPVVQPIAVLDDATTIGGNGALLLGMNTRSSSNKKVWRISDLTHTSGNEQILGGSVFYGTSEDLITSWTIVNAGGTTTVSLGNVSGGTQYANAVSCPTGTTVITLLTAIPLTTNLWVNANTTAVLKHFIEGKRTV